MAHEYTSDELAEKADERGVKGMTKTVTVEWVTTITEHHRAEIDAEDWADMVQNDRIEDGLADYEGEESLASFAVENRDASVAGVRA